MARLDWQRNRESASSELRAGETLRALFPALAATDDGGSGLMPAALIPVVTVVERLQRKRTTRQITKRSRLADDLAGALSGRR